MTTVWPQRTIAECNQLMCGPGAPYETKEVIIKSRPVRVFVTQPSSIRDQWEATRVFADKDYIVSPTERLTYAQTHAEVERVANMLRSRGVVKGMRVAIVMRNYAEWIISFYAIHSLGAVSVAVNAWSLPDALYHCLSISQSALAIVDDERANLLSPLLTQLKASGCKQVFVVRMSAAQIPAGMESFNDAVARAPRMPVSRVEIVDEDDCCMFFTSGTTGMPKAVFSSQRMYLTNTLLTTVAAVRAILRRGELPPAPDPNAPQKGMALVTPLFHVTGNQSFLALVTSTGGKLYLLHKWDLEEAVRAIKAEKLTACGGVPFICMQLIERLGTDSTIESYSFGGGAPPTLLPQLLKDNAGPDTSISQAYGLTETNAVVTSHAAEDYANRPGSCGLPSPVNDFKIINMETGESLPAGGIGEICCRGPNVATGYWGNEKATKESFSEDGWFRSGDVGFLDPEGWLFILDRAKEIIIRGGENISTVLVEDAIYSDARIRDCAVVPLLDYNMGELVGAFVTIKEQFRANPPTEAEIIKHAASRLPKFAVPVFVHVSKDADIERNVNGKTVKTSIKKFLNELWVEKQKAPPVSKL